MKIVRLFFIVAVAYLIIGLSLDAVIGYFQPQSEQTAVLRTFDVQGRSHDTVLRLLDDQGQLWVESGHWFRGWYRRVQHDPRVQLIRGDQVDDYAAVPVDTAEAVALVTRLMGRGETPRYFASRAMLLFAPIKPVRLDPRPPAAAGQAVR